MLSKARLLGVPLFVLLTLLIFGIGDPEGSPEAQAQTQTFDYGARIRPYALCPGQLPPSQSPTLTDGCVANVEKAFGKAKEAGMTSIDFEVSWAWTSRQEGVYDWRYADLMVNKARDRGMKITFLLTQTPDWVHPGLAATVPDAGRRSWTPPRGSTEMQHWENFVRAVVGRYKERVAHYEIWNEPNLPGFWQPETGAAPDAEQYVYLLRRAYYAAKAVYPQATIVSGGLSGNDLGYLRAYYEAAKDIYPDEARNNNYFFDVLGLHPYTNDRIPDYWMAEDRDRYTNGGRSIGVRGCDDPSNRNLGSCVGPSFVDFRRMKNLMEQEGDTGKKLFFSEYGVPTEESQGFEAVSDAQRALYLKRAYAKAREPGYVKGMNWFNYHPTLDSPPDKDLHEWAIVDKSFNPTLTYRAYRQMTGAEPLNGREVRIDLDENVSGIQSISPVLSNLTSSGIAKWELWVVGDAPELSVSASVPVKTQSTTPISWDTTGVRNCGNCYVMVAAYTTEGSVWTSRWDLVRVDNTPPTVAAKQPGPGATNVAPGIDVTATFVEAMDEGSVEASGVFKLEKQQGTGYVWVPATVTYDPATKKATLNPTNTLASGANYRATVTTGAKDLAGNSLQANNVWTFTTGQ